MRNAGKKAGYMKATHTFVSQLVIPYKIRKFKRIFYTERIVMFQNWLQYSGKPPSKTMLGGPCHGQNGSQWNPKLMGLGKP